MLKLFCLLTIMTACVPVLAKNVCAEIKTEDVSKNLKGITLAINLKDEKSKTANATISARAGEFRSVETPFDCLFKNKKWLCTQAMGAGDFILQIKDEAVTLQASYINLLIGSTKGFVFKENTEINEEFALYRSEEALSEEDLEHSRPKVFSISGRISTCPQNKP